MEMRGEECWGGVSGGTRRKEGDDFGSGNAATRNRRNTDQQ